MRSVDPVVQGLAAAGLVPADETPWAEPHRWVVEAARGLVAHGLDAATVVRLASLGRELGLLEAQALVADVAQGLGGPEALGREAERRRALTRFVAAVRHTAVAGTMRRLTALSEPFHEMVAEQLHVPSALFLAERGLVAHEEALRARVVAGDPDGPRRLGRFLLGVSRYAEAARWLEQAAGDPAILAHLAVARAFLGESEGARLAIQTALGLAPGRAVVLAFAGVVRAYYAGQADNVIAASTAVTEALDFLERSRQSQTADALEDVQVRLARGRIAAVLPADFGIHRQGLDDLRGVLRDAASVRHDEAPAGVLDIFRLHAAYFLGAALASDGLPGEARDALQEVVLIDPACALAERAYRRLGELG